MEDWLSQPGGGVVDRALLSPCSAQLDGIRDVGGVLVLDKSLFADAATLQCINITERCHNLANMIFDDAVAIFRVLTLRQIKRLLEIFEPEKGALPANVRSALATTWNNAQAALQPLLLEPLTIIQFTPQLD